MIVDDESTILMSLSHLLSNDKTSVMTCSCIEEAEEALARNAFDLVITDIRLSGMNCKEGLDLLSFIKKRHVDTAVIVMTAHGTEEIKEEAYRLGASHYYEKPVDLTDLISKVQSVI